MNEGNNSAWALYSDFSVLSYVRVYSLEVGGYSSSSSSTAPDSLAYHNNMPWSTWNDDNDFASYGNCAV